MAKLNFTGDQTQLDWFLQDFLTERCKGKELDAIDAAQHLQSVYGMRVDWHQFSHALDMLERIGLATITEYGAGGMAKYFIETRPQKR